jgi:hypothetical protein
LFLRSFFGWHPWWKRLLIPKIIGLYTVQQIVQAVLLKHRLKVFETIWTTFTYCRKEVRQITELLQKHRNKSSLSHTKHNKNILRPHTQTHKYSSSSIYQMNCLDCLLIYTGQTGRTFNSMYKERSIVCLKNVQ